MGQPGCMIVMEQELSQNNYNMYARLGQPLKKKFSRQENVILIQRNRTVKPAPAQVSLGICVRGVHDLCLRLGVDLALHDPGFLRRLGLGRWVHRVLGMLW